MRAFLANLEALFLALAFGSLLFGLLARLLGVRQAWPSSSSPPSSWPLAFFSG